MKIHSEAYGLKIGTDNSVTQALYDGKWGIRLSFLDEENVIKMDVALTREEACGLIDKIKESLVSIEKVLEFNAA